MTNAAAELLASKPNVLLDFDGPVCSVFGGVGADWVAAELRQRLGLTDNHSIDSRDPFDILRYAAAEGQREAADADRELTKLEVEAVASAPPTPGATELLQTLFIQGQHVAIVSNNSETAVRSYLNARGLGKFVRAVSARTDSRADRLKPSPHLLQRAIEELGGSPASSVMIGDSVADIEASWAARTSVVAFANKPDKLLRFRALEPDAVINRLGDLICSEK